MFVENDLIDNWVRKGPPTVGGTIPRLEGVGCKATGA